MEKYDMAIIDFDKATELKPQSLLGERGCQKADEEGGLLRRLSKSS